MQYSKFAVNDKPYCVWEFDLKRKNLDFIEGIHPEYFRFTAENNLGLLESEGRQYAALSLRLTYFHAMESFFALLMAAQQAPDCVIGWLLRYTNKGLRKLVESVNKGIPYYTKFKMPYYTWEDVSKLIHYCVIPQPSFGEEIAKKFADFWLLSAADFLAPRTIDEYNNIKHGFRVKPGGFSLKIGPDNCDPSQMIPLCNSEFGTSFFVPHTLIDKSAHFQARRASVNWDPVALAHRISLLAASIYNVIAFLKIVVGGSPPDRTTFKTPSPEEFEKCWNNSPGVISFNFDLNIKPEHILPYSPDEILGVYRVDPGPNK